MPPSGSAAISPNSFEPNTQTLNQDEFRAIIGLYYGLSPVRYQIIIQTNDVVVLNGPLGQYFNEILYETMCHAMNHMNICKKFPFKKTFTDGKQYLVLGYNMF